MSVINEIYKYIEELSIDFERQADLGVNPLLIKIRIENVIYRLSLIVGEVERHE